jgi:hypothetical protein
MIKESEDFEGERDSSSGGTTRERGLLTETGATK